MARDIDLYWLTGSYDALYGHGLERAQPLRPVRLEFEAMYLSLSEGADLAGVYLI